MVGCAICIFKRRVDSLRLAQSTAVLRRSYDVRRLASRDRELRSRLRLADGGRDLQALFGGQADKFEPGAGGGSVAHDGNGCHRLPLQPELNLNGFSNLYISLHNATHTALAQIKADAACSAHATAAQMTDRDGNGEQNSGMVAEEFIHSMRLDSRVGSD